MSKLESIKRSFINGFNYLKETNKLQKIISFLVGFFFNFLGIILVAIWKYIFCNDNDKSKYCIRVAILGMIMETFLCIKILTLSMFSGLYKEMKHLSKIGPVKTIKIEKFIDDDYFDDDFLDFDKAIERMNRRFNRRFERRQKIMDEMLEEHKKEIQKMEEEYQNNKNNKNINIKKIERNKNGFNEVSYEKRTPNSYKTIINIEYDSDKLNKNNKNIELNKSNKIRKNVKNKKEQNNKKK